MPTIKEQIQTIQQEAEDNKKEHSRKERETHLENIMILFDLMMENGPDKEIDLNAKEFLKAGQSLRVDGVLADLMKDMDDRQLLDAIKAPENFYGILKKDYAEKAAANREEKRIKQYLGKKQEFVDKFETNRDLLMRVYGPDGKMPTDLNLNQDIINEYNGIKLDVPEGMDKETAMCIIIGCCFDKESLVKADPGFETASPQAFNVARNTMLDGILLGDGRPSPCPKAMVEGKKEAQKVFEAYRNNDKGPAIEKLNNVILHESEMIGGTFALSGGNNSGNFSPTKTMNMIVPEMIEKNKDLGLDYNVKRPTITPAIRCASICKQLKAGKASEEAKIYLGNNFFNMDQAAREEKTADMLFNGYLSRMGLAMRGERDKIANDLKVNIVTSIGHPEFSAPDLKMDELLDKFKIAQEHYSISDFDLIMSKPDGTEKIRELYIDKIKETDIYKKIIGAKDRNQLFEAFEDSDMAVSAGFSSIKGVNLPEVSGKFNAANKYKLDYAAEKLHDNIIKFVYSEKDFAAGEVDEYGLNSLAPEALRKNSRNMDLIYDNIEGVSKNAPQQFNEFMLKLKECKDMAKSFTKLGRNACHSEVSGFSDLMRSAESKADKYLMECGDDKPERVKKTQEMRGLLTAVTMRSDNVAKKGIDKKCEEVCGDRFNVFNKYGLKVQDKLFRGEKYKDFVPPSKHGFSSGRTGNVTMTIMAMAASGKYNLDDIIDPEKYVNEKKQMFDEVTKRLSRGLPEDQEWAAEVLHEGRKASEMLVDEKARQINFSKADISDKEYCKLLQYGFFQFDAYQECSHCADEIIKLANADKTEEHPEFKNVDEYILWTDGRLNALGNICEGYEHIQRKAGELMEEQVNPAESARQLIAEACRGSEKEL